MCRTSKAPNNPIDLGAIQWAWNISPQDYFIVFCAGAFIAAVGIAYIGFALWVCGKGNLRDEACKE